MTDISWIKKHFDELDIEQLYDLLKLRVDVFVVQQQCAYPELDNKDKDSETIHLLGIQQGKLISYCRILAPGQSYPQPSIGRVVVADSHRGQGLAGEMLQMAIRLSNLSWPEYDIKIGAQEHLLLFYQSHGFSPEGPSYLEDGIPHVDMILQRPPTTE
ncbi:GNAT family N-acetyltransferase [Motiliproteus sp. MSK22-1]|uniref:GNAT family N-acetyltransferase n=1 Tax=Motiliproteus sp. MSK22-1 TaxID=1897630 RepID=UPI00097783FC|nr:GNAT family N-acetyltransferase [Motiliproteus sp. MSK22-1]OMH38084.1 GNAT family N-acetyltransferase [Motiliproteus sp. MSK22-1]